MQHLYRVGKFAELTGVSIRTLHHYDQIGLLRPTAHSNAGYRLYSTGDLLRLQQILTLRFLGFGLKEARALVDRPDFDLVASLRIQQSVLAERISELERIRATLRELLDDRLRTGAWDWSLVASASAGINEELNRSGEQMESYYTPEQMKQFEELGKLVSTEDRQAIEQGWLALLADLHVVRDALDPASPEACDLADRWEQLTAATMKHYENYPELKEAIAEGYRQDRFAQVEGAPRPEDFAFIQRVQEVRQARGAE